MVFEKTTFERLFPASVSVNGLLTQTTFGFEASGKRHFVVKVPGKPRIEQGMAVVALLKRPGDWGSDSLLGWVDCAEGALICNSAAKLFSICLLSAFFAILVPMRAYAVISTPTVANAVAILLAVAFGAIACRLLYLFVKALLVKAALARVRHLVVPRSIKPKAGAAVERNASS